VGVVVSAEIVIPPSLRLRWIDAMVLDNGLSATAVRVACVIGMHFNNVDGQTFVSQRTIARRLDVTERTVQTATAELERCGWLLIGRHDCGVRKDGRPVAGGKRHANTYRPTLERTKYASSFASRKDEADCALTEPKGRNLVFAKDEADFVPTLKKDNSKTRARGLWVDEDSKDDRAVRAHRRRQGLVGTPMFVTNPESGRRGYWVPAELLQAATQRATNPPSRAETQQGAAEQELGDRRALKQENP